MYKHRPSSPNEKSWLCHWWKACLYEAHLHTVQTSDICNQIIGRRIPLHPGILLLYINTDRSSFSSWSGTSNDDLLLFARPSPVPIKYLFPHRPRYKLSLSVLSAVCTLRWQISAPYNKVYTESNIIATLAARSPIALTSLLELLRTAGWIFRNSVYRLLRWTSPWNCMLVVRFS